MTEPIDEQIQAWIAKWWKDSNWDGENAVMGVARLAYAAGRRAGLERAEVAARQMFNRAATGDEIADAIRALIDKEGS